MIESMRQWFRAERVVAAYSLYLVATAARLAWLLLREPWNPNESPICWGWVGLLLIHARWNWLGAPSPSFRGASAVGRLLATALLLLVPAVAASAAMRPLPLPPVAVPHLTRGFAVAELAWLLLQLLGSSSGAPGAQSPVSWNRALFGVWLVGLGFWMLLDAASFGVFFGLASRQAAFALDASGVPAADWTAALAWDALGLAPFYALACWTRLLGLYNVVAGLYGIAPLIRAGKQGGTTFAVLCLAMVLLRGVSWRVLLIPAVDVLSIVSLPRLGRGKGPVAGTDKRQ